MARGSTTLRPARSPGASSAASASWGGCARCWCGSCNIGASPTSSTPTRRSSAAASGSTRSTPSRSWSAWRQTMARGRRSTSSCAARCARSTCSAISCSAMETRSVSAISSELERRLEPEPGSAALARVAEEVHRIRRSVALSECDHVTALLLSGPRVANVVSAVCPLELYVQDGQMLHTLLLDDAARPLADVYVGAEGESMFLIVDGLDAGELDSYLSAASPEFRSLERQNLVDTHRHVSLNGP